MSWTNFDERVQQLKTTALNGIVVMNEYNIAQMVSQFDTIFSNLTSFADEIASVIALPINIKVPNPSVQDDYTLHTAKGEIQQVNCKPFDETNAYRTLGEFYVKPKYNNFADYKGYTQIKVFLPFLGFVDVDPNECMGKYLQFRLSIDFYTGKGLYIIGVSDNSITHSTSYIDRDTDIGMRVISTFECDLAIEIPMGRSNIGDIKRNLLLGSVKTIASVGAAIYTGTLPAPVITETTTKTYDIQGRSTRKGARMRQMKSGTETTESTRTTSKPFNASRPISEAVDGSLDVLNRNYVNSNTDRVSDAGLMYTMSLSTYVVIYRPRLQPINDDYDFLYGRPVGFIYPLSNVGGYTEISNIHIEGEDFAQITSEEMAELETLLLSQNGIILPDTVNELNKFYANKNSYSYSPTITTWEEFVNSSHNINNDFTITTTVGVSRVKYKGSNLLYNDSGISKDELIEKDRSYYT